MKPAAGMRLAVGMRPATGSDEADSGDKAGSEDEASIIGLLYNTCPSLDVPTTWLVYSSKSPAIQMQLCLIASQGPSSGPVPHALPRSSPVRQHWVLEATFAL